MARRSPRTSTRPGSFPRPAAPATPPEEEGAPAWLGERLRRAALGLTAALMACRAYWQSEYSAENGSFDRGVINNIGGVGDGLIWIVALLVVAGLGVAAMLIGGRARIRFARTDALVYILMLLVGLSSTYGAERRVAINLAWEWAAFGVLFALLRNLPRTPRETSALAGALTATAVAVAGYGMYQVAVEMPRLREQYRANPHHALRLLGVTPGSSQQKALEDRLLGSREPTATFALANSLAGFLVGPTALGLAVALEALRRRDGRGSTASALALAAPPGLVLLTCLLLTKSRSAYVGLAAALAVLAWRAWGRVPARTIALVGTVLVGLAALLVAAGLATGQLDALVLTESTKSLRYRWEYWQGAWRVIWAGPRSWLTGYGPGNFAGPYLRFKLPQSSEEIRDPHNLVLDVWATAGLGAAVALVGALGLALRDLLGPGQWAVPAEPGEGQLARPRRGPGDPPERAHWLVAIAGGGWLLVPVVGQLNPFVPDLTMRWLVLGVVWLWAVLMGLPLWNRGPLPASGFGAAALAMIVNLLAAGGIGMPAVAQALWGLIALGMNLRTDRPCGRVIDFGGRLQAFGFAVVWSALMGSFLGAILPYWRARLAMSEAEDAMLATPPQYEKARDAYFRATKLDRYSVRPHLSLAEVERAFWLSRGEEEDSGIWRLIPPTIERAIEPPRNPNSLEVQGRRAEIALEILGRLGDKLPINEQIRLRGQVVKASRIASQLYPSSAALHAELALANGDLAAIAPAPMLLEESVREAEEAFRLDRLTPHADKKLPPSLRRRLEQGLARWREELRRAKSSAPTGAGGSKATETTPAPGS